MNSSVVISVTSCLILLLSIRFRMDSTHFLKKVANHLIFKYNVWIRTSVFIIWSIVLSVLRRFDSKLNSCRKSNWLKCLHFWTSSHGFNLIQRRIVDQTEGILFCYLDIFHPPLLYPVYRWYTPLNQPQCHPNPLAFLGIHNQLSWSRMHSRF